MTPRAIAQAPARLSASAISWSVFETGRISYAVLIGVYMFMPYVASVLVGDPVAGQSFVAQISQGAGLLIMLTAPLLGVTLDHLGPRKPLLVCLAAISAALLVLLWWAAPGGSGLSLFHLGLILALAGTAFGLSEMLHNSMLVFAAQPAERPYASGLAMAIGNAATVVLMLGVLWAFVLPGTVGQAAWLPEAPLFGLNVRAHEPERFAGPLVAVILLVALAPLALMARDAPRQGHSLPEALTLGWRDLRGLWGLLREHANARNYLAARLLFADGQIGIVIFTGVLAAGVLGWGPRELLVEGLLGSTFAALGGLLAGAMDSRLGVKRSIHVSLAGTALCVVGEIGIAKDRIFYFWAYDPALHGRPWSGPIFTTWPEWAFIACDLGVGVFVVAGLASSRTMMAQLAPPDRSAAFFGLYALSGRATAWLCPMLVAAATAAFGSQQLGLTPILFLLAAGALVLTTVQAPPRDDLALGQAQPGEA